MEWNLTMFAIHVIALVLAALLYRSAPCWMQKLVVVGLGIAFAVMAVAYACAMAGVDWWWHLAAIAFSIEHIAVLIYIFRVVWQGGLKHGADTRVTAAAR